jgi:N utilization substance protein B
MGKRRNARESALQVLYHLDFDDIPSEYALRLYWRERKAPDDVKDYTGWIVSGIISHREMIDEIIHSHSDNWRISRMAVVDRNILRIAVFELVFEKNIAAAIILDEAIEIAKKFSSEKAANFVNGILDSINKNIKTIKKTFEDKENDGHRGKSKHS